MNNYGLILFIVTSCLVANPVRAQNAAYADVPPLFQCQGKPVKNLDLPQFVATKDQGGNGTCAVFAANAGVESAMYRQTGKKHRLSESFATANACVKEGPEELAQRLAAIKAKGNLGHGSPLDYFAGFHHERVIDNILALEKAPWESEELFNKFLAAKKRIGHGLIDNEVKLIALKKEIIDLAEKFELAKITVEKLEAQKNKTTQNLQEFDRKKVEFSSLGHQLWSKEKELMNDDTINATWVCRELDCFKQDALKTKTASLVHLMRSTARVPFESQIAEIREKNACNFYQNMDVISELEKRLCMGVPVVTGVLPGVAVENYGFMEGQGNQKKLKSNPGAHISQHAMVVTGVAEIDDKRYLKLRNSWANQGEIFVPIEQACKFLNPTSVVNNRPINGETMAESEALIREDREFTRARLTNPNFVKVEYAGALLQDEAPTSGHSAPAKHSGADPAPTPDTLQRSLKLKK